MCATVACRLLSYDAKSEAKELLSHAKSRSQLMRTEKGILVLLAASVDAHVWQVIILSFLFLFFLENNYREIEYRSQKQFVVSIMCVVLRILDLRFLACFKLLTEV